MLRDARRIMGLADPLQAEAWASDWLGQAWLNAPLGEREAEHLLCMETCGRACTTPSPHGLAAVAAMARVAPANAVDIYLDEFREAFDDQTSWGPAKQIVAALSHTCS